jgi:hypothetical protein
MIAGLTYKLLVGEGPVSGPVSGPDSSLEEATEA